MIYITQPNVDDICELDKIVSIESCRDCKYCKELHKGLNTHFGTIDFNCITINCDYENN